MVASAYTDEFSDAAICHRNVELGHGKRGVFISTRLMGDRFALSFEFFINVAHAFVDQAGVPAVLRRPGLEAGPQQRARRDQHRCLGDPQPRLRPPRQRAA